MCKKGNLIQTVKKIKMNKARVKRKVTKKCTVFLDCISTGENTYTHTHINTGIGKLVCMSRN